MLLSQGLSRRHSQPPLTVLDHSLRYLVRIESYCWYISATAKVHETPLSKNVIYEPAVVEVYNSLLPPPGCPLGMVIVALFYISGRRVGRNRL